MAADSSTDETDAAAAAAEDKPAAVPDKPAGPPRPPRPVRRMSGSLRIPLPSAITPGAKLSSRAEPARVEPTRVEPATLAPSESAEREPDSSPGRGTPAQPVKAVELVATAEPGEAAEPLDMAEPGNPAPRTMPSPGMPARKTRPSQLDPQDVPTPLPPKRASAPPAAITSPALPGEAAGNIEFSLTRRSSAAPPLSFDSKDVDPSDRAPAAPLTPWRDVPPLKEASASSSPPAVEADDENDHEDTLVGEVPKNLLDLASEEREEEHTRAYQAPQELIELARREREVRRQARAREEQKKDAKAKFADSIPPTARAADELKDDQSDVATATVPLDSLAADAAPPVMRTSAVRGAPLDEPGQGGQVSNAPASLEELVAAVSGPGERESIPVVSEVLSADRLPDSMPDFSSSPRWWSRGRTWALLVGLVIVVGFALARWGGVELPLSR